jgi:hypothetical protein
MKDKFAKLIDVKTIVTFAVITVFVYLAVTEKIPVDQVMIVVSIIITFFFAKSPTPDTTSTETKTTSTTDNK